jgi:dolichyl-phosphate beta-glucosyltransferase
MDEVINYSIVIPAYNEEGGITASLTQVMNYMSSFDPLFEIIVVDDGSIDSTAQKVEDYAQYHSEITLIKNLHKGKAAAVTTGVMAAQGKYILTADADMATPVDEIKRFVHWLQEHEYDIVIASREGAGAKRQGEPLFRHIIGRVFNFMVRIIAVPQFADTQCGFKLYTKDVAHDIFSRLIVYKDTDKVIKKPFLGAFDVELIFIALKRGYKVKAVPVTWTYVKTTRLNFLGTSYKMARDVIKIRLNGLKGAYK